MKPYSDVGQRSVKRGVGSAKKKKVAVQKSIAKVSALPVDCRQFCLRGKINRED